MLIPAADVSVFSGVLEYLNNVEDILAKSIKVSHYVLLSYYFIPLTSQHDDDDNYLKTIHQRVINGVRNHYTSKEMISIARSLGVISGVDLWINGRTNHILLLLRNFNSK